MRQSRETDIPLQTSNPIILEFCLKEISVKALKKRPGNRLPNPFAVISWDGKSRYTTDKQLSTLEPCWWQSIVISARPSSALQIELFHASWLLDKSLGKLTARISDLIEADITLPLIDKHGTNTDTRVNIKLSIHASSTPSEDLGFEVDGGQAMDRLAYSDGPIANISNVVDQGDTITTQAQSAYEAAQVFSSSAEPIGQALQSLAQVVGVVDGLVEAHPVAKAAWIVLSSVYKALQRQMREDENIRSLAESMCQTLAFACKCPDLLKIE